MKLRRKPRIKVIMAASRAVQPDDPSYPYKLLVQLEAPDTGMSAIALYPGGERYVVRGVSPRALEKFFDKNKFEENRRFRKCEITDRDGRVVWSLRQQ
jgi:hypothetical protein